MIFAKWACISFFVLIFAVISGVIFAVLINDTNDENKEHGK